MLQTANGGCWHDCTLLHSTSFTLSFFFPKAQLSLVENWTHGIIGALRLTRGSDEERKLDKKGHMPRFRRCRCLRGKARLGRKFGSARKALSGTINSSWHLLNVAVEGIRERVDPLQEILKLAAIAWFDLYYFATMHKFA